jgi:hypothetical protein
MSIKIATIPVFKALLSVKYDKKLVDLVVWMSARYSEVTIVSAWRPEKIHAKDSGIHITQPCRAMDFRSSCFDDPASVVKDINTNWQYDPARPERVCALYHDVGLGPHIHVQVHENTCERG